MSGLIFALLATLLAGIGARDQLTVAGIAARQGQRPGLLVVALATSIATAGAAAYGGALLAPMMGGNARLMFAALALAFAGVEMLILAARKMPDEPTQSLGATAIVLSAHQLTDAARFLIFAIAVATRAPISAGIGGAFGGVCIVLAGWLAAGNLPARKLSIIRRSAGAALLVLAAVLAMKAMGRG